MIKQLTIRGLDDELDRSIRELAEREGISLNKATIRLLRKGAGIEPRPKKNVVGNSLDHLAGTWTEEEAREFDGIIEEEFEQIDPEMWK